MLRALEAVQDWLNYSASKGLNFHGNDGKGKIGTTGYLLGMVGGFHLALVVVSVAQGGPATPLLSWSLYVASLCWFHFFEFFTTAVCQPQSLGYDSYVVNHSLAYTAAALGSWVEFWVEWWLWGSRGKLNLPMMLCGLGLVVGGQAIRSLSMWTCGEHFDHQIMEQRREGHKLVTTGIYSVLRHPSYFGWFYWSVGTQVLLCNPICTVLYIGASWRFFNARIPFEEETLHGFYRQAYIDYCSTTIVGIPFISSRAGRSRGNER
jgi:protein-S-isoprenylcysteine O-methyltransferase